MKRKKHAVDNNGARAETNINEDGVAPSSIKANGSEPSSLIIAAPDIGLYIEENSGEKSKEQGIEVERNTPDVEKSGETSVAAAARFAVRRQGAALAQQLRDVRLEESEPL